MYCRGCGYDLQKLDTDRCPECGRAFDPDDHKTYHRTARRYTVRRIIRSHLWKLAVAAMVLYMASYMLLVDAVMPTVQSRRQRLLGPFMLTYTPLSTGPGTWGPPMPMEATYPWGGDALKYLYTPVNWVDRLIRRDMWLLYPQPFDGIKLWELTPTFETHPQFERWRNDFMTLYQQRDMLLPDDSEHKEFTQQMHALLDEMKAAANERK
jgi:hypothetical protein